MVHTPTSIHESCVRPVSPGLMWPYQWYKIVKKISNAIVLALQPYSMPEIPNLASINCLVCSIPHGSHPNQYIWETCQVWFSWHYVTIQMIWNSSEYAKCCRICIMTVFFDVETQPNEYGLFDVKRALWFTSQPIYIQAMPDLFLLIIHNHTNDMKQLQSCQVLSYFHCDCILCQRDPT